ncbi:MAG: hypothetical protein ACI8QD_000146 [Cyclobacteriaceae bacterium]|jgi:hypothetical protein
MNLITNPIATMNLMHIAPTRISPEVVINAKDKIFLMKGRSSPENAVMFYDQIKSGIKNYFQKEQKLSVHFMFEYFNTSSSKSIFEVIKLLKKFQGIGKEITFFWVYEEGDDDMLETGEDYADLLDVEMTLLEIDELEDYSLYRRLAS